MTLRTRLPILLVLLCAIIMAAGVFTAIPLRMDMQTFLPRPHDEASRFLLDEVNHGATQSLMMASVEGGDEADRESVTRRFHDLLEQGGLFQLVLDGPASLDWPRDQLLFLAHRYGLAPHDRTRLFTPAALKADTAQLYDLLQSMAAPLVEEIGLQDPTGAYGDYLASLGSTAPPTSHDGLWSTRDHRATLMLLQLRQPSLDTARLAALHDTVMRAFGQSRGARKDIRLVLTGSPVFSFLAARSLRHDMDRLALLSLVLIVTVLYWRFRSLWVLAIIAIPFLLSLSLSMVVVKLAFGWVHGIAVGFGMTMLGVSLDYPVLLLGHRDRGEGMAVVLARIGPSLKLAALTAIIGLLSMILCGLPGLVQLGLFSATGILTAACLTIWVLPGLVTRADLASYQHGVSPSLLRWETLRRHCWACLLIVPPALLLLWLHPFHMERRGEVLNPVPPAMQEKDRQLRQQLGAPQAGLLAVISDTDCEHVLQREEALLAHMPAPQEMEAAALLLPSKRRQQQRSATLPSQDVVETSLRAALQGSPFQPEAFAAFPPAVERARHLPPLGMEDLAGTSLSYRLQLLLKPRQGRWDGLILPRTPEAEHELSQARRDDPGLLLVNLKTAVGDLLLPHVLRAEYGLLWGIGLALPGLALCLRDLRRAAFTTLTLGLTGLGTLALLRLHGTVFSIIHIVALAFVLGVGIDYALFFSRPQLDGAERTRTLRTLLTCNIMTVLSFTILASCETPLLREMGLTIAIGALLAMIFSFLLMGSRPATLPAGKQA